MLEWNVVVSVQEHGFKAARQLLHEYGRTAATDYFNVLAMQVDDVPRFLEQMRLLTEMQVPALAAIARVVPVTERFLFQSVEEFEAQAREVAAKWLPELAGRHFYVRMRRRGFKGRISSQEEERFLDEFILGELEKTGQPPAKVDFSAAERVIAVETLGQQAGMSLWTREQLERFPFLKLV